jgi:hypothetical protein
MRHMWFGWPAWRTLDLWPHRVAAFERSTAPAFVAKVRDVVGLYPNLPDRALVLGKPQTRPAQQARRTWLMCSRRPAGRLERLARCRLVLHDR